MSGGQGHGDTGSGVHLLCLLPVNKCRCDGQSHTYAGHDAITSELVACTLGARHRPELQTTRPTVVRMMRALGLSH